MLSLARKCAGLFPFEEAAKAYTNLLDDHTRESQYSFFNSLALNRSVCKSPLTILHFIATGLSRAFAHTFTLNVQDSFLKLDFYSFRSPINEPKTDPYITLTLGL